MREKFNIWGKGPMSKKDCYETYQNIKKNWSIDYVLNEEETKYMKEMMDIGYQSPIKPGMVQDVWKKYRDSIVEISVVKGPIFKEKTIWFWTKKRTFKYINNSNFFKIIDNPGEYFDFSVARCICFPGQTGYTHESDYPKAAVHRAMVNEIAAPKIKWKKDQGYKSGIDPIMHAHHVDGKEFKTIKQKFFNELKITEDEWVNKIYPTHGNFDTAKIEYITIVGWNFKLDDRSNFFKNIWFDFHERNREYELIDPSTHRKLTSDEIKFNTNIRNRFNEVE
jgi:hypothetical protein